MTNEELIEKLKSGHPFEIKHYFGFGDDDRFDWVDSECSQFEGFRSVPPIFGSKYEFFILYKKATGPTYLAWLEDVRLKELEMPYE